MTDAGFILLHRSLLGHPAFRNDGEAMCFAWMIARAAWKPVRVRYKGMPIRLERGQLAISIRDMAAAMDRGTGWCERILKRLKNETMIETHAETGVTVITICNYDRFQASKEGAETPCETPDKTEARQGRDTEQRREQDNKGIKEVVDDAGGRANLVLVQDDFPVDLTSLTNEICRSAGIRHLEPGMIIKHHAIVKGWLDEGFSVAEVIQPSIRETIAHATERIGSLSYFDRSVRQFHARREAQAHGYAKRSSDEPQNPMVRAAIARLARTAAERGDDHGLRAVASD